jgi:hypothetical protein
MLVERNSKEAQMAGLVQRIIARQTFDSAAAIGSGNTLIALTVRRIETSRWREASLLARLHATTNWPSAASIQFFVGPDGYTDEDPATIWSMPGGGVVVSFTSGAPANDVLGTVRIGSIGSVITIIPSLIQVQVRLVGPGTPARVTVDASCDLILKGE